ncbi:hypothetical protein [Salimicrobium album]|uniref:Flagellar protein FliT n=1 Tax=Salimicrobium album TaxID=50717 RepID=A0A1H3DCR5_9BACI|nr:hypothetical protein [Salimicrobium album]SDX64312.1 hypothetical protein SAMN04488081_0919 [Salimicrobium album]
MEDMETFLTDLRNTLKDAPKEYDQLHQDLKRVEGELNDIHHYIEFCNINAAQAWKVYDSQRTLYRERRTIKDRMETLKATKHLFDRMRKQYGNEMNQVLGNVRKLKETQKVRSYRPRVRSEYAEIINNRKDD